MSKIIKETIFVALFLAVVILMIGILFYEFIPNKIIPDGSRYTQASSTAKLISQIQEEKQTELEDNKKESVLKSYEVTTDELSRYENQKNYVSGKNHPFLNYRDISTNTSSNEGGGSGSSSGNTSTKDPDDINPSNSSNTSSNTSSSNSSNTENSTNSSTSTNKINTNGLRDTTNSSKTSK